MFEFNQILRELGFGSTILRGLIGALSRILYIDRANDLVASIDATDGYEFSRALLSRLSIRHYSNALSNIPLTGPCIVVANHPTGILDGLILLDLLGSVRTDVRIPVNYLLQTVFPETTGIFADELIYVNPFDKEKEKRSSVGGLKDILRALVQRQLVLFFPAGDISTFHPSRLRVMDNEWNQTCMRLVFKSRVPVVPLYIQCHNGPLFHVCNTISAKLGLLLTLRELFTKAGASITVHVGAPIMPDPAEELDTFKCRLRDSVDRLSDDKPRTRTVIDAARRTITPNHHFNETKP